MPSKKATKLRKDGERQGCILQICLYDFEAGLMEMGSKQMGQTGLVVLLKMYTIISWVLTLICSALTNKFDGGDDEDDDG